MRGNSYDLTMMRAKKSSKRLTTMVGIALLVVLLGAIPGYAAAPPVVSDIPDQTIAEGGTQSHGPPERGSRLPAMGAGT